MENRVAVQVADRAFHVLVVGAGGNGGYVVADLARLAYGLTGDRDAQIKITVVDGDRVEAKNLLRQHFVPPDLGELKSEVLATRYGNAYGLNISFSGNFVESDDALEEMLYYRETMGDGWYKEYMPVLVGCVDNNRTRQLFNRIFEKVSRIVYIDAGNGVSEGQVAVGYKTCRLCIPPVGRWFPDILTDQDTRFPSQASCSNVAVDEPQSFLANRTAATLIMGFLTNVIVYGELRTYLATFDCRTGVTRPRFITEEILKQLEEPGTLRRIA